MMLSRRDKITAASDLYVARRFGGNRSDETLVSRRRIDPKERGTTQGRERMNDFLGGYANGGKPDQPKKYGKNKTENEEGDDFSCV
jgi:hypothetical protein